jgi:Cof subfamily protein (haloacid dehalogenase superfamily)
MFAFGVYLPNKLLLKNLCLVFDMIGQILVPDGGLFRQVNVKVLVFDIDGTILNTKGTMTGSTYRALIECHRKGLILCVATARSGRLVFRKQEIPWEHNFLQERGIYYNGGTVFDNPHHFYQHTAIPGPVVAQVVSQILEHDHTLQIALQHDNLYHAFSTPMPEAHLASWGFKQAELVDFQMAKSQPTTKIMVFEGTDFHIISTDLSALYYGLVQRFSNMVDIILADSGKAIYILSRHATKGKAINTLISLYGIRPEEVAVFGDDTPDAGMFGLFGYSIAMGNAHESLKTHSTFITKSNDEDGVAFALSEYLKVL